MEQSRAHAKQNDREDGLVPWPMVAFRMSQLLNKQVTAHQCRGLHAIAIKKIRHILTHPTKAKAPARAEAGEGR